MFRTHMSRLTPIRIALFEQNRSQKWLAEEIGKSEPVVSRIVNGQRCRENTQRAIAQALGCPVEDLFPPALLVSEPAA